MSELFTIGSIIYAFVIGIGLVTESNSKVEFNQLLIAHYTACPVYLIIR
jgi:hypothetical protein